MPNTSDLLPLNYSLTVVTPNDLTLAHSSQRRLLSTTTPTPTLFSAVISLAGLNGENGFKLDGEASNDWSGSSVSAVGDVNGDGHADLLIGAYKHASETGRSYVVFGGHGVGSSEILALSGLNGTNGFKLDGESANDWSGYSVSAVGDINGDGYADLLIGAYKHASGTGRSYVVFGGSGVESSEILALSSLNGTNGFKLDGESANDWSGYSVSAAGDINGDGYADMLIGAPYAGSSTGRSYVVFGGPGVGSSGLLALSGLNGINGFKLDGESVNDWSGYSVSAAGDINGDGHADLLIGAPHHAGYRGRSYVVFGGPGVGSSGLLALSGLNGTNGLKLDNSESDLSDYSGYSVSMAGDINGDGYADLLIGAYNSGTSYVVFGGHRVGNGLLALSNLNGTNGFKLDGEATDDHSGSSVSAAGDINGDGYADLLIGALGHAIGAGRSYVVFGGPAVGSSGLLALSSLNGTNGFKLDGESSNDWNDWSGYSVSAAGDINGDGHADLLIGAPHHASWTGRSYVVFGDNTSPQIWANHLTIHSGETLLLTANNLNATGTVTVTFTIYNAQRGHFQLLSSPGQVITEFTQSQVLNGQIQFVHDGNQSTPGYTVQATNRIAISTLQAANITFYRRPTILINQLSVNQAQKLSMTSNFLSVVDDYPASEVNFTISNLQHGQFQLAPLNVSVQQFSEQQLLSNQVSFIHDGSRSAPTYQVSVSDPYFTVPPASASITFYRQPTLLSNQLIVNQGQKLLMISAFLNVTEDYSSSQVNFTISGLQHGQFQLAPTYTSITQFGEQQLLNKQVYFVHDGSPSIPSYQVELNDPYFTLSPFPATVTFYRRPTIVTNQLSVNQGQKVLFTSASLNVTEDYLPSQVTFTVTGLQHGQFQLAPLNTSITQFTGQQLLNQQVLFVQDGSSSAPNYQVSVRDPYFNLPSISTNVTFYRKPAVLNNRVSINQGQMLLMTSNFLSITDDYLSNQVNLTISNLQHGQFQLAPLNLSVTQFSAQQLLNNQVFFIQDNTSNTPSYQVGVSDPYFNLPPASATVTFYRRPMLVSSNLMINQAQSLTLPSSFLTLANEDYPANQVIITVSNLQHGQFKLLPSNTIVTQFTLQELLSSQVVFTHDSSQAAPSEKIAISDPYFTTAPQATDVIFTPLPPTFIHNQLSTLQGRSTALTLQDLQGSDPDLSFNLNSLIFLVSQVQHGQFTIVTAPSQPITEFTQGQINAGQIIFTQDNSASSPGYEVILSDGRLSSTPQPASITFDAAPVLTNNRLTITQGTSVILDITSLKATDDHTPAGNLLFSVSGVQQGYFALEQTGTTIVQFSQQQVDNAEIEFISDGTPLAPTYAITVTDGASLSAGPQSAQVTFLSTGGTESSGYSSAIRNAIIGGAISGLMGLLFLALQMVVKRRAEKYFEQATIDADGGAAKEHADFHKNVVSPITKRILERVTIAGITGYVSQDTARDTVSAIIVIIHELERQGIKMENLGELTKTQRTLLIDLVARQTRHVLAPDVRCCSATRFARFFCAETTPQRMEDKAGEIATRVKKAWDGQNSQKNVDQKALIVEDIGQKASLELKSFSSKNDDDSVSGDISSPLPLPRGRSSSREDLDSVVEASSSRHAGIFSGAGKNSEVASSSVGEAPAP